MINPSFNNGESPPENIPAHRRYPRTSTTGNPHYERAGVERRDMRDSTEVNNAQRR